MILPQNILFLKLKVLFVLLLLLVSPLKTLGQELEWVYTTESDLEKNTLSQTVPRFIFRVITTNTNNEIYAVGTQNGYHQFEINGNELVFSTASSLTDVMVVKLDENKNVLWAKQIKGGLYDFGSIKVDFNGNLIISGTVKPYQSSLYLNPNLTIPPFNTLMPTHENLTENSTYGFVLKWDSSGNYIDSSLFEGTTVIDATIDNGNNIIITGFTSLNALRYGYIGKFDNNLNLIWDKTYTNQGDSNVLFNVVSDSQNNLFFQGTFRNSFTFGSDTLQSSGSEFICKMTQNGTEEWIIQTGNLLGNPSSSQNAPILNKKIKIDTADKLYFYTTYFENYSYTFSNVIIDNLILINETETVLFKIDSNGNYYFHITLAGTENQNIIDFDINNLGDLITIIGSNSFDLQYGSNTIIDSSGEDSFLLKSNQAGELIDFKRLAVKGVIDIDTANNILIGASINKPSDFDPNPFDEFIKYPILYNNGNSDNVFYESMGFVLKLSNCDIEPLFLDSYNFCEINNPNPTLGDIEPNDFNINWYSSANAQTPLTSDFLITSGETYYMEKISENCPVLVRQPVLMNILPISAPPIIEEIQPCYYENLTLQDLNINGQNILFYASLEADEPISNSTLVIPDMVCYVSQTISCESQRIPISLYRLELNINNYTIVICDVDENNFEFVNLTNYKNYFSDAPELTASYHTLYEDAFEDSNPILNPENYYTNNQTFYIRFESTQNDCFEIATLIFNLLSPVQKVDVLVNDFSRNNSITVTPPSGENYTYSLNGINYQNSNYFENLIPGEYTVYIKNEAGCITLSDNIYVLDYPRFFTPNGDSFNDTWKIEFTQFEFLLNIEIYDRYGKLLATFNKDSTGWDGSLNGVLLPATDYWFKIIRISNKKTIYNGHFSLLR